MRKIAVNILVAISFCYCASSCWGFALPEADSLPYTISQSQVIAVFKIDSLDIGAIPRPEPSGPAGLFLGPDAFITLSTFQGKGIYNLSAVKSIKGNINPQLTIKFPALTEMGYASTFQMKPGDFLIAFLREENDSWVAQDPWRPFVPLFANPTLTTTPAGNPLQQVESLIIPEIKSENTRLMAVDLLSRSTHPQVFVALAPYIDDSNLRVRDLVLSTFARNRQLIAINRIRDLNRMGTHPRAITLLTNYSSMKEAMPLLNPLLFENEQFIRINALDALSRTKDINTIPFLLLTLYDPEPQKENAPKAYAMITQISDAKLSIGAGDFALHPDEARKAAWSWWQDELSGKHPADADEKPAVELRQIQKFEASDLPQLNLGLFMKSETTRRAAARGLEGFADQSSIPYLLIALYDPVPDIAASAYATLHRVVPDLGVATPSKWKTERGAQTKLAYDWWQKHLLDAEKKQLAF